MVTFLIATMVYGALLGALGVVLFLRHGDGQDGGPR